MRFSFSTLACPDWTFSQIIGAASASAYDGIELRFVQNEDSLWKLPDFRGEQLTVSKRALSDRGLTICCVDTSCRFHFPDARERAQWIEEGERMAELAAVLGAPGIRVFGDQIQPGADRKSTCKWIADSIRILADKISGSGVEVWLETHGDFASGPETTAILNLATVENTGVIWDPANCYLEHDERPNAGAAGLRGRIRHVHLKDMQRTGDGWRLVLTGEGDFPLAEVRCSLSEIGFTGFVSLEWEKKWHPEIADASVALPHFAHWFRENWQ